MLPCNVVVRAADDGTTVVEAFDPDAMMGLADSSETLRAVAVAVAVAAAKIKIASGASVFALGTVYALAGFCSGPLLGSVLTVSAAGGDPAYGGVLMAFYALGMAAPLFVLALFWDRLNLGRKTWLRGREITMGPLRTHTTSLISGLLFIAIGALFLFTEGTANLGGFTSVDTQFTLQVWLQDLTSNVSNAAVLLALVAGALTVLVVRLARSRGQRHKQPRQPEDSGVQ